jgi:AraC-like DNA-binding protein
MHDIVRAGGLVGFSNLVRRLGGDPNAILEGVGLREDMLSDPDRYLPYRNVLAAIESGARTLGANDFGLRFAAAQDLDFLGTLAMAIQAAESIRAGIVTAATHFHFHTPGARLLIVDGERPSEECIQFRFLVKDLPPVPQATEHAVCHVTQVVSMLSQGETTPRRIHFRHAAIGLASTYVTHLGQVPQFESSFDGIAMDRDEFRQSLPHHDKQLENFFEQFMMGISPPVDLPIDEQLRDVLQHLMRVHRVALSDAANALRMSPRTLQRGLRTRGCTFQEILDGVRQDLTGRLLDQKSIPLSHIAHTLGFADQSVFTRACRRWFGRTPGAIRRSRT